MKGREQKIRRRNTRADKIRVHKIREERIIADDINESKRRRVQMCGW